MIYDMQINKICIYSYNETWLSLALSSGVYASSNFVTHFLMKDSSSFDHLIRMFGPFLLHSACLHPIIFGLGRCWVGRRRSGSNSIERGFERGEIKEVTAFT